MPCRKIKHPTYEGALKHIKQLQDKGLTKGAMHPYVCRRCGVYHVGHCKRRSCR